MPLYDCVMLLKPSVTKDAAMDLITRVGKHVYARNGVITNVKTFHKIELGYGIKKLDGRYFQGHLMQMTMMATPNINKELHYLNKEDRLLRWLIVKHRNTKYGLHHMNDDRPDPRFRRGQAQGQGLGQGLGLNFLAGEIGKDDANIFSFTSIYPDEDGDVGGANDDGEEYELSSDEAKTEY